MPSSRISRRRRAAAFVQLGATVLVLLPVAALTQPFLPGAPAAAVISLAFVVVGVAFWQTATNLQGHVRAGAQIIVEAVAKHATAGHHARADGDADRLPRDVPRPGRARRGAAAHRYAGRRSVDL